MDKTTEFDFLKRLAKGLVEQFGKNCEVTVHDLSKSYDETIIAIENGYITGRKVSDGASEIIMKALAKGEDVPDRYAYFTRTTDGKELKSSSFFIRDEDDKPIALLAVNYDVSELKLAKSIIDEMIFIQEEAEQANSTDIIPNNVNNLLDLLIEEAYQMTGKPVNMMTREDKVKAIHYLEQRGALLIKKSGDKISSFFDISKYTLYGYLSSEDEN